MTSLGHRIRGLFSAISGSIYSMQAAPGAALVGVGLVLLVGGTAQATEIEHGEAEQAPPGVVGDPAPGLVEAATPVSPARVVAHTTQLPKAASKANPKLLLAADLSKSAAAVTTSSHSAGSAQAADGMTPAKTKLVATKAGTPTTTTARRPRLTLAPSSGEIRREIAARNGGPPTVNSANSGAEANKASQSTGNRLQEQATTPPQQNKRWPTHVDYTAGPTGPAGGNTAAERKGAMIEATGPQQGVIRNQW